MNISRKTCFQFFPVSILSRVRSGTIFHCKRHFISGDPQGSFCATFTILRNTSLQPMPHGFTVAVSKLLRFAHIFYIDETVIIFIFSLFLWHNTTSVLKAMSCYFSLWNSINSWKNAGQICNAGILWFSSSVSHRHLWKLIFEKL